MSARINRTLAGSFLLCALCTILAPCRFMLVLDSSSLVPAYDMDCTVLVLALLRPPPRQASP